MTSVADHYQTLGVMPEAEQIVITAAYRALASRYHPDRWKGDKDEATRMMSRINVAYGVLGDAEKRKAYDASRGPARSAFSEQTDETEDAFEEAIHDYDERWETACSVYPDLKNLREKLAKTSRILAFNFVVRILETKQFENRDRLATQMERSFLERHFGSNQKIIEYTRSLIQYGERDAIRYLNKLVDVLGDGADAQKIIDTVNSRYFTDNVKRQRAQYAKSAEDERQKRNSAMYALAQKNGYVIKSDMGGFFAKYSITIKNRGNSSVLFETDTHEKMADWIASHIA